MAHPAHIENNNPIHQLQSCKVADQRIEVQQEVLATAQDANNQEHGLSLLQAIKLYPKAVGWSVLLSTALVMEGYDTKLVSSLFAQPAFKEAYGVQQEDGSYQIPAPWQAGLTNGSACGQIIGLMIAGHITERFGFRKTMMSGLSVLTGFIFVQFFAPSLPVLEVAQILMGRLSSSPVFTTLMCCRYPPGHFPDCHHRLCSRGDSNLSSCVLDELRQYVLGKLSDHQT